MQDTRTRDPLPSLWERGLDFLRELEDRDVRIKPSRDSQVIACPLPEHDDRTPSCSITRSDGDKWLVNCHGCGFQGDGIDLLAAVDKQTVPDWMRARASRGDTVVPTPTRVRPPAPRVQVVEHDPDELAAWLDDCHAALLSGGASGHARAYCRERGLRGDEVRRHRIGYSLARPPSGVTGWAHDRLILPVPGAGFEARTLDGDTSPKYVTVGAKRPPWGMADLDPARSPLLIVEGILDAIACRREVDGAPVNHNTIALRGKTLQAVDAAALARLGFATAYVALDADVAVDVKREVGVRLQDASIRPWFVRGPSGGQDFGALLRLDDDALVAAFVEAVRLT